MQPPAEHLALKHSPPSAQDQQLIQQAQARTVFPALLAEADQLTRHGHYTAAAALYSRALEILPTDATALAARARCHILREDSISALVDANAALAVDADNWKALHAKGDALFNSGDFENALLCYHRGAQARPDLDEFRGGIVRATEAICSAVAGINPEKLRAQRAAEEEADFGGRKLSAAAATTAGNRPLRKHHRHAPQQQHHRHHGHHPGAVGRTLSSTSLKRPPPTNAPRAPTTPGLHRSPSAAAEGKSSRPTSASTSPRAVLERNLLEELYDDHAFLLALAADASLADAADGSIAALVDEGCRYMQSRLDYWRVRNPSGRPQSARERGTGIIGSISRPGSSSSNRARPGAATPDRRTRPMYF
ncbi:Tetratricopeptide repeat protein 25 [Geranomyces michiganensis]|nr:Tetratricopeptide repeat protein 25 [Geranomyces michiganensis]